ncbi:FAD-dependent oxidoreductase [Micromonospora sp. 4G57]|uniref:FAD-dependent oxidoreductase n=1 Tax=Micromonospora sicca TaxID=2202420 RepID=A0ABU5JE29_9ACTN|nr:MULTISPECIES: FAD-dependent oxidoreductase [unclassified Micromonospora]MDZ5445026.1 FAD-dependent oxidoreductase [Micromonospora sp. 4G57]MDZ5490854.1 FAD-dependent oxidoreductase [Micromonospora sp. 4G53]
MNGGVLIVGASQAGVHLAASLRDYGHDAAITVVGAESHPPYERPPLSKAFLAGTADIATLPLRTGSFYAEQRITVLAAERVTRLHLSPSGPPGSGTALTDRGRTLTFDRLALTVGARPRRLHVPGVGLDGVCYLRGVDDAAQIRTHLAAARDVVVVGGGFIGLEVAAVARSEGANVTVVEAADRLIARSVAPEISEFYRRAHIRRGTRIRLGAGVAAIEGEHGRVTGVQLVDGELLPAGLVVVGVGVVPRTELAEQLGLRCDGGIVVDEYARTSESAVVAAGDCTAAPDPLTGEGRMRLESVPNAVAQARAAAATLVGRQQPYTDVPWFWSDQYDLKLQIAGVPIGYDQLVVRGDPDGESFSVLYYRGGRLLAINAVNNTRDYLTVRKALASGMSIPAEGAAASDVPLKELLLRPAA